MARKRMLDPAIWDSEQVMQLSPHGFKLFVYLISQADDEGRVRLSFPMLVARVFPFGGCDEPCCRELVDNMRMVGLVRIYSVEGCQYLDHPNWRRYQKIDRPTPSRLPAFVEGSSSAPVMLDTKLIEENIRKEKGNTLSGDESPDAVDELLNEQKLTPDPIPYSKIVDCLNAEAGTQYKSAAKETRRLIKARWNDGFRIGDFEAVIRCMCGKWKTDAKFVQYLRPITLFGTKFEGYLQAAGAKRTARTRPVTESHPCDVCGKECFRGEGSYWTCPNPEHGRREGVS